MKKAQKKAQKNSVKNNTDSKKIIQPSQPSASVDTLKTDKAVNVFKYETTFPRLTLNDKKEIVKLLKAESKEVKDRITERGIKLTDIIKLSKYGHKQLLNGKFKSGSMKYFLTLQNDKKICLNFRITDNK
jgi:hypothetical protein